MDEFRQEEEEYEEIVEEEAEVLEEEEEANKAETADLQRMFRQHPEIWIPYEEQVQERLIPTGPKDPHHRTYPLITRYEMTKIISFRASQLCNGANPYILVPEGVTDAYQIAKLELQAKRLPYILKRPLPNGTYEYWRLADLLLVE
jgi:DNA-directed RNA polymerase I, II, and III subunit RPABC2